MRTKTLLLAAALSAAGIVSSLAQSNVYSVNVVGYVNRTCANTGTDLGGFTLLANPLDSGTNTLNGVLASFLPANYQVLKWNGASFATYTRTASGWLPPTGGSATVNPGEGFFVKVPTGSNAITVTFVGDVKQGTLVNTYSPTQIVTLSGNLFPDSGTLTSMGMTNINALDRVQLWTGSSYATYTRNSGNTGWLPPGPGPSINPADGFFVASTNGFTWTRNVTVQ